MPTGASFRLVTRHFESCIVDCIHETDPNPHLQDVPHGCMYNGIYLNTRGTRAIHLAAATGDVRAVDSLLEAKADVNPGGRIRVGPESRVR